MNLQTREEYFGDNWYRVLDYTEHDFTRQSLTWEKLIHPEDQIKFSSAIEEHLEGHTSRYEVELRMRNKNGNWQWFMARGRVVDWTGEGTPLRIVGTYTDISQSKANELELQTMKESLEEKVAQRTEELLELNVTLKVLLKKWNKISRTLNRKCLINWLSWLIHTWNNSITPV